jgi:AAA+ ATPase superfamily predicted ATPase
MAAFIGRSREISSLEHHLARVVEGRVAGSAGQCILVRGRRRVGKSRLLEEFCERAGVPSVFFAASQQGALEPTLFAHEVAESNLPGRELFVDASPASWDAALRLLAAAVDSTVPTIVVIDEFPYLVAGDPTVEATFQK